MRDEGGEGSSREQLRQLLHELQVHQVELEQQNEELREAKSVANAARDRYAELYEKAPVGFTTLDEEGRIVEANLALTAVLRRDREELLGRRLAEFVAPAARDDLHRHLQRVRREGAAASLEVEVPVEGAPPVLARFQTSLVPPAVLRTAVLDVTAERCVEATRERLARLEGLGALAAGLAHDFNNFLTGILGSLSLAREELPPGSEALSILGNAEQAALGARGLTRQLLTFARGGDPVLEPVALEPLVELHSRFALAGSTVACRVVLAHGLRPVAADRLQLGQVLDNLLRNAAEAQPAGGTVELVARNVDAVPGSPELPADLPPGRWVRVDVTDHGPGIAPRVLARLFEPYVTTKTGGHGLGLATAHSIVLRHGGRLLVSSTSGAGTTFTLLLPAAAAPEAVEVRAPVVDPGPARILFMDDDQLILSSTGRLLRRLGHEVVTARDGAEAVEAWAAALRAGRPFAVAILDLTVPGGVGGLECLARLRALTPDVRAIVASGYSDDPVLADHERFGFCASVPKPYGLRDLAEGIRRALVARRGV